MKPRRLLQGAGVAALVLFPIYVNVIDGPSSLRMHSPAPLTIYILSILVNLALVSIAFAFLGGWILQTARWRWLRLLLPPLVLASIAELIYLTRRGTESIPLWLGIVGVITILSIALHWRWRRGENILLRVCGATLMGLGFYCGFVVLQLFYLAAWRPLPNFTQVVSPPALHSVDHPRVVWIIFDELSYDQVFGHRFRSLQLPNFDRFRESSTVFANVQPVINETEEAVPSMLLGQKVTRVEFTYANRLKVGIGNAPLQPFDAARTPFSTARRQGLTTGIAGWYNPYCGTLTPGLNDCYWTDEMLMPAVFQDAGFWQDLLGSWKRYYERISHRSRGSQAVSARIGAYRELMRHSDRLLQPDGPDFILIHLPLPHPPGFYNRFNGDLDASGTRSYIDNLALTDKTLGQMLAVLQRSPRWNSTSVVICGDHSWRVHMWSHDHFWTDEGETASHGIFDPRPMLMVHVGGQTSAVTVDAPFPLLRVHEIVNDLVQGKKPVYASTLH